ncbi:MAG: bacteriohemerythrin [Ignavibacteria bacterium]
MADHNEGPFREEWDASLATGVASLDEQHKSLFDCINLLAEATAEHSMLRTFYVLEQLSSYAHLHFAEEEFLMRVHGFPALADHVRAHRAFSNRLHELRRIYLDRDISTDLILMLREWLKTHVAQTDMEYVPYLKAASPIAQMQNLPAAMARPAQAAQPCLA